MRKFILLIALLYLFTGCMSYYKVQTEKSVSENSLLQYTTQNKYLILHRGDSAWHLSDEKIILNALSGNLSDLPANRYKFKTTKLKGSTRYKNNPQEDETLVLEEVHLYLNDSQYSGLRSESSINIPLSAFSKAEVYIKDKGKTRRSWLFPILSFPAALIVLVVGAGISGGLGFVSFAY